MSNPAAPLSWGEAVQHTQTLRQEIAGAIFGQEPLITETLCTFLASGHILMTGAPGLAKTTLVRVIAKSLGAAFGRIQFTPDLLPTDIIGSDILNIDPENGRRHFEFAPGPIFVNLLLADEINRAAPRTQSAMLEAMQERNVTTSGHEHRLPRPFMVFATQNPFESEGTFPLPEAQLDRFLLHTLVTYPDQESELRILEEHARSALVGETESANWHRKSTPLSLPIIEGLIQTVKMVALPQEVLLGINALVRSSRPEDASCPDHLRSGIWYGAGPRAGISLVSAARAFALLSGDEMVQWKHVRRLIKPALRHRIRLSSQAMRDRVDADTIIEELCTRIESQHRALTKG